MSSITMKHCVSTIARIVVITSVVVLVQLGHFTCEARRRGSVLKSSSDLVNVNKPGKHSLSSSTLLCVFLHWSLQSLILIYHFTECQFGRELHELKSKWHPNLGEPFGVMYCIECECEPVVKFIADTHRRQLKRRHIVGHPKCRPINEECPEVTCDEPIQMPGKCCKVCPGDAHSK